MSKQYPGGFITKNPTAPTVNAAPGIWTLDQALQYKKAGTWPGPFDPQFNYVTMLLPGNGTNGAQNNTFLDSSTNNFTITRNGNTTQGTFAPYGSNWSNYFDGTGDYLSVADNAALELGSGDFTLEGWGYMNSLPSSGSRYTIFGKWAGPVSYICNVYNNSGTMQIEFGYSTDGTTVNTIASNASGLVANSWLHLAWTRSGNNLYMFVNGSLISTNSLTGTLADTATSVDIGRNGNAVNYWTGYISNVRILKGTAQYTAAFTPPTSPLTAITNTSLLTCQSNRFIDNSTNNFTVTRNGDVSVQVFSPFSPTASYAAGTIGGSGYFDGTGDYLNTPATGQFAPTGDFTIAVWYYPTTLSTNNIVIANYTADLTTDWQINVTSTGSVEFYTNGNPIRISGGSVRAGAWNYIVLARSGSTLTGYLNGTSIGTYTQSGTFGSATKTIWVGSRPFSGSPLPITGYISDVKLIDGSAVTTVPTAPQTATTGTNLLLSFTNAGIIDNAMMNDLETVADAQISTTQSKWGGSSIAFDGTGDYLQLQPNSQNFNFGVSGDYTIETWLYQTNRKTDIVPIFQTAGSNVAGYLFGIDASNGNLVIYDGGATRIGSTSSAVSLNTWTHVAATRSGGTTRVFIDGTLVGSATYTYSSTSYADPRIGINASYTPAIFQGYMDDFRITKGYARYTANFTPPSAPFFTS